MTRVFSSSSSGFVPDFYSTCNNNFHTELLTKGCVSCARDQGCWATCEKIFETAKEARSACMEQEDVKNRWQIAGFLGLFIGVPLLGLFLSEMSRYQPARSDFKEKKDVVEQPVRAKEFQKKSL